ncbi:MAG: hypothetical protein FD136_1145 [Chitinophagaceae bacterium]|nr:MAG: hypothetical protein FD136_1145 [Chitinophagaceae bacterium]
MKNKNILTWILLIVLTLITTIIAGMGSVAYLILVVAALKFLLIAFQFMEFKNIFYFIYRKFMKSHSTINVTDIKSAWILKMFLA